jgi:hypothetical protein
MSPTLDEVKLHIRQAPWGVRKIGTYAVYIPINGIYGAKLYQWKDQRDNTYRLQNIASQHGLAPNIGSAFQTVAMNKWGQYGTMYGYITESIAQTFREMLIDRFDWKERLTQEQREKGLRILKNYRPAITLKNSLEKLRFTTNDFDTYNTGWLPNGRFVLIDFSDERIA